MPLPTRFMVVSKPAMKSKVAVLSSSAWVSLSPAVSAASSAESRSLRGWDRRASTRSVKYWKRYMPATMPLSMASLSR